MADFSALVNLINANINKNGVQAITGNILNGVLRGMVEALGKGYTIAGEATPTTNPGTMTGPVAYIAHAAGTYPHFGNLVVNQGEVAMLIYDESVWTKNVIASLAAAATVDNTVGIPSVDTTFEDGVLTFNFSNLKGNPGEDGDPAGFGTVSATVDDNIGTPSVEVTASGPNTGKNIAFVFRNLKGETGVTSVVATVDNTVGTPSCAVTLVGQVLHLDFSGLKGIQGNTGSSVDYPFEIVNNLTTEDATKALSASMGKQLQDEAMQSAANIGTMSDLMTTDKTSLVGAINEAGISFAAKTALFELLEKVAYIDGNGQDYLETLYAYLFPGIVSIDAVFTQGQAVIYDEDDLSTLKQYLVVTALYQDGTTRVLPDNSYILSGTLEAGTSTITATYAGKTDTFTVVVTATPREVLFGIFTDGYAVSKITTIGQYTHRTYRSAVAARATTQIPFENKGYVFTVTDAAKYNIAVYDIQSLTQYPSPPNVGAVDEYCYMGEDKSVSWKTQDSVSTPFAWLALKKMDGTAFTAAELADGAAEVFTFTKGN